MACFLIFFFAISLNKEDKSILSMKREWNNPQSTFNLAKQKSEISISPAPTLEMKIIDSISPKLTIVDNMAQVTVILSVIAPIIGILSFIPMLIINYCLRRKKANKTKKFPSDNTTNPQFQPENHIEEN